MMTDRSKTRNREGGGLPVIGDLASTCPGKIEVPTKKEQEALAAMKEIKERVRVLKKRLALPAASGDAGGDEETAKLEGELGRLKADWERWETKRKAAARERMILLGHEEGP